MGGIIMGALGGLGEQAANLGGTMFKAELDRDARRMDSDLALSRAKALEEFKVGLGNAERAAQTARIDSAAQGIIGSKLADKANKLYGDKSNLTVDDLADEEKQALALSDQENAAARTQAAIKTGDISPKDAMLDDTRQQIASVRAQSAMDVQGAKQQAFMEKLAYMQDRSDKDRASREMIAAMRALGGGGENGETAKIKTAKTYLEQVNKDRAAKGLEPMEFEEAFSIANYAPKADAEQGIRARVAMALTKEDPRLLKDKGKLRQAVDEAMAAIEASDATPKPPKPAAPAPAPTPKPAASAVSSLPPGAKQIGTSGGKPVYQTPDGKRFIAQ